MQLIGFILFCTVLVIYMRTAEPTTEKVRFYWKAQKLTPSDSNDNISHLEHNADSTLFQC